MTYETLPTDTITCLLIKGQNDQAFLFTLSIILWSCYKIKICEIRGDFTSVILNVLISGVNGRPRMFNNVIIRYLDHKNKRLDTTIMILH